MAGKLKIASKGEGIIHFDQGKQLYYTKVPYVDSSGKQGRKTIYGKTSKEVAAKKKEFRQQIDKGLVVGADKTTLKAYILKWLEVDKKPPKTELTTYNIYAKQIELNINPELGHYKLKDLTRVILQEYFDKKSENLAAATLRQIKAVLSSCFKTAVIDGLLYKSPLLGVKLPQVPRQKEMQPLEPADVRKLLGAAEGHNIYGLIYFMLFTGVRVGEAAGVRWKDVDLAGRKASIMQTVKHDTTSNTFITGKVKTGAGMRTIGLPDNLVVELKRQKARQAAQTLEFGKCYTKTDLVFTPPEGGVLKLDLVRHAFGKMVKAAGIKRITPHDLRHSFASIAINQGMDIGILSKSLGHASVSITYDKYGHLMKGDRQQLADVVANYLLAGG